MLIERNGEREKYDELVVQSNKYKLLNRIKCEKKNVNMYNENNNL